jgi:very-short-patch-repair endonuclease
VAHRADAVAVLDDHLVALHGRRAPWGVSLHEVQEAVSAFAVTPSPPRSRVRLHDDVLARLDPTSLAAAVRTLTQLADLARWDDAGEQGGKGEGEKGGNPWYGARIESPAEATEARERVERLAGGAVAEAGRTFAEVFRGIQLPRHPTVLDWGRVLRTVGDVRDTLEVFRSEVFDIPLRDLVAATASSADRRASGVELSARDRWRLRRQARSLLRPGRPPADLHAALAAAHEQRDAWRELAGSGGRPEIPVELDRAREAHGALVDDLRWLDERLATPDARGAEQPSLVELDLPALTERVVALAASLDRLEVAPAVRRALDTLEGSGLRPLADDLRARAVPADAVGPEVEWVWWCSLAEHIGRDDERVAGHDGPALTARLAELEAAEATVLAGNPGRIRAAVARHVQDVRRSRPRQETRLRAEAARVRPTPLPEVVAAAADLVTAVRPCWAMSPLDVPSVLPAAELFDVVVIEEASAVAAAEAVPAVTRGRRVVVVGDRAQSPPSGLTTTPGGPTTDDASLPSVLDLLAPTLPARHLTWHHRSRDGRLVEFVGEQVYGGSLVTFPDTDRRPVLRHERVDGHGVVTAGDSAVETTAAEVERVVALVLDHVRHRPDRSLAVVALNAAHAESVGRMLHTSLSDADERTRAFFADERRERFVIRTLDRAQGEERDDVILTVGFGKTPHGRVIHRFGALGSDAGARHLTVALTRARRSLTVVSSITAEDLDPERLKASGTVLLRGLLEHLASRSGESGRAIADAGGRGPRSSVLVADLARRLRAHGLTVHEDVGVGPAPVDLAVEDPTRPGTLLLAVESDGPRYAAAPSARDRDRLRAEVLARRGWRHLRVWSTDLFRDPARDVARILEAVGVREAPGDD